MAACIVGHKIYGPARFSTGGLCGQPDDDALSAGFCPLETGALDATLMLPTGGLLARQYGDDYGAYSVVTTHIVRPGSWA